MSTPPHSKGYWRWRVRVCRRWIRDAKARLAVPVPLSPFTPDPRSARYWTHRFFGYGTTADLVLCIAYRESRYELSPPPSGYYGPWQVSKYWHPWVDTYRLTHLWRYAAAVTWRVSGFGTDFSAWRGDCGL